MLKFADFRSTNKELLELGLEVGSFKKKRVYGFRRLSKLP